jgi:hypothetical protein
VLKEVDMQAKRRLRASWIVVGMAVLAGCAGAAASRPTVARTTRGVESFLPGAADHVEGRARIALAELGVDVVGYTVTEDGAARVLEGRVSDVLVTVELHVDTDGSTRTEVVARRSPAHWDRRFARALLDRIATLG